MKNTMDKDDDVLLSSVITLIVLSLIFSMSTLIYVRRATLDVSVETVNVVGLVPKNDDDINELIIMRDIVLPDDDTDLSESNKPVPILEVEEVVFEYSIGEPPLMEEEVIEETIEEEPELRFYLDDETYNLFCKIVEAEVTGDDIKYNGKKVSKDDILLSKVRVAQVFMNRVDSNNEDFKKITTLRESITQKGATSTLIDGRAWDVEVNDFTREAVNIALLASTPDYTDGALFFKSGSDYCRWGDYMFTDPVGHHFFK